MIERQTRMALLGSNSSARPQISDDDLLAAVHTCGASGNVDNLRECLRARIGIDPDSSYLADRLNRLHRAGYVRRFQPHVTDIARYRLTEIGIERLDQSDLEPPVGSTG
jgi:hypothetical protein